MAGVTVAVVALPLALAFGVGSAAAGLLTAVICGFVISLLGGAFYQISGPTGAMAAILMSIVAQYGMSGVFAAAVLAGILLILAGVFHLGRVTAYLPMPVITGFTSGIAAIARTSVAIKSGAQTRLTGMIHAVVLLISMLLLAPVMAQIPLSALAGVLMVTAWRMNEWETIRYLFSYRFKGAILKFTATMAATILFDLTIAILAGVIVALILLVVRLSRLEIHYDKVNPERLNAPGEIAQEYRSAQVVYVTGAVIFANTEQISAVYDAVKEAPAVIFSMRGTSYMDISGAQNFLQLIERLKNENKTIAVCGVSDSVCEMMHRRGIADCVGKEHFYWSVARALQSAQP